jgi:hypothetical protein
VKCYRLPPRCMNSSVMNERVEEKVYEPVRYQIEIMKKEIEL